MEILGKTHRNPWGKNKSSSGFTSCSQVIAEFDGTSSGVKVVEIDSMLIEASCFFFFFFFFLNNIYIYSLVFSRVIFFPLFFC